MSNLQRCFKAAKVSYVAVFILTWFIICPALNTIVPYGCFMALASFVMLSSVEHDSSLWLLHGSCIVRHAVEVPADRPLVFINLHRIEAKCAHVCKNEPKYGRHAKNTCCLFNDLPGLFSVHWLSDDRMARPHI